MAANSIGVNRRVMDSDAAAANSGCHGGVRRKKLVSGIPAASSFFSEPLDEHRSFFDNINKYIAAFSFCFIKILQ